MAKRTPLQLGLLSLKGMAMGAADVVPGVSGGTIAFISGIYEELITGLNNINLQALKVLRKEGGKAFWQHVNGTFFIFLFLGIAISIVTLSKVVTGLLTDYPVLIWSFFFGLILSSVWLISKSIKSWSVLTVGAMLAGVGVAYYITSIQTVAKVESEWFIVLSGALAICAMILPGISGAFILLLLGSYDMVLGAINERDLARIGLFALGCGIGLLSFARILKVLFTKFKSVTIALLTGFMLGSLNKVWPWKSTVSYRINSHGEEVPFIQENVLPTSYEGEASVLFAIGSMVIGFLLIFILEKLGKREE